MAKQLYAANLHSGGAVVTTAAILKEIVAIRGEDPDLEVLVSSEVSHAMGDVRAHSVKLKEVDDRPTLSTMKLRRKPRLEKRLVFFGPDYRFRQSKVTICGFADATTLAPAITSAESTARQSTRGWMAMLKQRLLMRYDEYVVQTESAAERLRTLVGPKPIHVIPNCIHPLFLLQREPIRYRLPARSSPGTVRMIYPAAPHPHKNHAVIDSVGKELSRVGIDLEVVATVPFDSALGQDLGHSPYAVNVGPLSIPQLIDAYRQCDAVFFPSLLETFSTVTIEGRFMGLPVFASDRWFVREVAADHPIYFEPDLPRAIAETIESWVADGSPHPASGEIDEEHLPETSARKYLDLLE